MIPKQQILERAREWNLRPEIVEKDYVLGWLLAAIGAHPELGDAWILKGGTCLKKCYFETYRFSEDLDFSLLPQAAYTQTDLSRQLREVVAAAHDASGIELPEADVRVDVRRNKQGQETFQARITYRGPLSMPTAPRLLLDITQHEAVIDAPVRRAVFHAYPDELTDTATVAAYSLEELFAEKTRALYERTRPRDLYDVMQLVENYARAIDLNTARKIFRDKCLAKSLVVPSGAELTRQVRASDELAAEWKNMLGHQLPALPPLDAILARLDGILEWLDEPQATPSAVARPAPPAATAAHEGELVAPAGVTFWGAGEAPLELVRFAGANRLMIEFDYHGKHRKAAPYSLRRAGTGNLLLYAKEQDAAHAKAFKVTEISGLAVSSTPFTPDYPIELTTIAFVGTGASRSSTGASRPKALRPAPTSRRVAPKHGPTYVFQCSFCGKKFRHSRNDPSLRSHKGPDGHYNCTGRRGFLVTIE